VCECERERDREGGETASMRCVFSQILCLMIFLTCHTVEFDPFIKSQLASHSQLLGLLWCTFGHVTLEFWSQRNPRPPPCGPQILQFKDLTAGEASRTVLPHDAHLLLRSNASFYYSALSKVFLIEIRTKILLVVQNNRRTHSI